MKTRYVLSMRKLHVLVFGVIVWACVVVMSWRDVQRAAQNDDLAPPTGDNVRKQAAYALKALLKVFGGDESKTADFLSFLGDF